MFKSLAVAMLLGFGQAADTHTGSGDRHKHHEEMEKGHDRLGIEKDKTDDEKRGIEMMKGFFIGSGTVDLPPHKGKELQDCANYLEHVVTYGDNAYNNFKNFMKK